MQFKTFAAAAALAGAASASPLVDRQYAPVPQATSSRVIPSAYSVPQVSSSRTVPHVSNVPHVSYAPHVSGIPHVSGGPRIPIASGIPHMQPKSDGYGMLYPGNFSIVFHPVSKTIKISGFLGTELKTEEHKLACEQYGSRYETIRSELLPAFMPLNVHGGNLCTSNNVQYYLWASRMYEYLWMAYGMMPVDVAHDDHCKLVNRGEVARCVLSKYVPYGASPGAISGGAHVSGVPRVSGYHHVSGAPRPTINSAHISSVPKPTSVPHYAQFSSFVTSPKPTSTPAATTIPLKPTTPVAIGY